MPQMMPLMWMPLFSLFSTIMLVALTKIYFSSSKTLISRKEELMLLTKNSTHYWLW